MSSQVKQNANGQAKATDGAKSEKKLSFAETLHELYNQKGRRRVPRRPIEQRVGLLIGGEYYVAWAYEIGEGGMLLASPVPLNDKDKVVITLRIPGVMSGVVQGHALYCLASGDKFKSSRYGIQFDKIDFEFKRQIRNYVAANTGSNLE